jgi:hypothetical protein
VLQQKDNLRISLDSLQLHLCGPCLIGHVSVFGELRFIRALHGQGESRYWGLSFVETHMFSCVGTCS